MVSRNLPNSKKYDVLRNIMNYFKAQLQTCTLKISLKP